MNRFNKGDKINLYLMGKQQPYEPIEILDVQCGSNKEVSYVVHLKDCDLTLVMTEKCIINSI